jgi:RecJ-like exonuclease
MRHRCSCHDEPCEECEGTGQVDPDPQCPSCSGTGNNCDCGICPECDGQGELHIVCRVCGDPDSLPGGHDDY